MTTADLSAPRPSGVAQCTTCGKRWAGKLECHCRLCHQHFTSPWTFDMHKPSYAGCGDPWVMTKESGELLFKLEVSKAYGEVWARNVEYRGPGAEADQ